MPLKRASAPPPRRRWRSIAVMRVTAASNEGSGGWPRAAMHWRSGSRARSSATRGGRGGGRAARGQGLARREGVEQQLDEGGGVAVRVSAVGEDLALELEAKQLLRL